MKQLKITKREDNPSEYQIQEFEKIIGAKLPDDYKYFLENYNPKFSVEKSTILNNNEYIIHNWLPLSPNEEISLSNTFEWTKELLLGKYLAFALDAGDWLFVIGLTGNDYGKIFFCRPDQELEAGLTLLTNSFDEFINGLR